MQRVVVVALGAVLVSCGAVKVRPEQQLPRALLQPLDVHAALVLDEELRGYHHEETRGGGDWSVALGPGHEQMFRSVFGASFADLQIYSSLNAARAATGMQVIFQPHIEQFSFATARETSGSYWAVTIRYRIGVLSPQGEPVDSLTLTGYGSAMGARNAGTSLTAATRVAMRDAASKFLVQMPRQALAKKLLSGQSLSAADASTVVDMVEAVPIKAATPDG
ncbi:MAG: hypothetical protein ABIP38_06590 [Steroidobacteraceae bacterium]